MSAFREQQFVAGRGWTAEVSQGLAVLHVDPAGDNLPNAVETLVSPTRRRFVTVEWINEDDRGWDVYEMVFATPAARLALI